MIETMVDHEFTRNFDQDAVVVHHVGQVRNVHVEVWASQAHNHIALVVTPTISGFTILAEGKPSDTQVFANVGRTVLQAMAGVLPIATGDWFKAAAASPRDVQAPRLTPRAPQRPAEPAAGRTSGAGSENGATAASGPVPAPVPAPARDPEQPVRS